MQGVLPRRNVPAMGDSKAQGTHSQITGAILIPFTPVIRRPASLTRANIKVVTAKYPLRDQVKKGQENLLRLPFL